MLSKFSVKKPYTVIVGIILVIVLGVISFANMTTDLLPNMDLPYVAVYTTYVGATPEQVESDVTRPMEASFATLSDISGITSTSAENLSIIILEFESGVDMNSVLIELSSQIDMLRGSWSDSVGAPVVMQINPDMLPVSIASVSLEGADVRELTDFVDETLLPKLGGHRRRGLRVRLRRGGGDCLHHHRRRPHRTSQQSHPPRSGRGTGRRGSAAQQRASADFRGQAPARPRKEQRPWADRRCAFPTLRRGAFPSRSRRRRRSAKRCKRSLRRQRPPSPPWRRSPP